jgi:hypothetical protein
MPRRVRGGILQEQLEGKLHELYDRPDLVTLKDKAIELIDFILSNLTDDQKTRGEEISSVLENMLTAAENNQWKEMNTQLVELYQPLFPLSLVQANIRKIKILEILHNFNVYKGRGKRSKRGSGLSFEEFKKLYKKLVDDVIVYSIEEQLELLKKFKQTILAFISKDKHAEVSRAYDELVSSGYFSNPDNNVTDEIWQKFAGLLFDKFKTFAPMPSRNTRGGGICKKCGLRK